MNRIQINIAIPAHWKPYLQKLARKISYQEDNTVTYLDLIRRAIKEKYNLSDDVKYEMPKEK